ncbi:MAG: class I SAM-dependent methyltransferase [Candidatus Margulisiibacteriota bacterium]
MKKIYKVRFNGELRKKQEMWKILCENYFQQFIDDKNDIVLDLAAGYGEFLNNIKAKEKIAVDLNEDIKNYISKDIKIIISDCKNIKDLQNNSVDKIFISNFLEHLNNTNEVIQVLKECYRILKTNGQIMILQPNICYVKEKYWFFIDHKTPLTHESLIEALKICDFKTKLLIKKFLPYSTKSNLPQNNFLIKIYLGFPFLWWLFGKQSFVVAEK